MGIVYLKENTVQDRNVFEKQKKSFNSKILIDYTDANEKSTSSLLVDDFSIDITLGKSWNENYSYNDRSLFMIEGETISIKPRSSVVVSIRENISIPNNMFGLVISTGSIFLQHGVQSPTAKIEPGYSGVLVLRLVNYSDSVVTIKKGQKIASMIFLRTEHTPPHTFATNSESTNIKKKGFLERTKSTTANFFAKNLSNIFACLSLIVAIFAALNNTNNNQQSQQSQQSQQEIDKGNESANN